VKTHREWRLAKNRKGEKEKQQKKTAEKKRNLV